MRPRGTCAPDSFGAWEGRSAHPKMCGTIRPIRYRFSDKSSESIGRVVSSLNAASLPSLISNAALSPTSSAARAHRQYQRSSNSPEHLKSRRRTSSPKLNVGFVVEFSTTATCAMFLVEILDAARSLATSRPPPTASVLCSLRAIAYCPRSQLLKPVRLQVQPQFARTD